MVAPEVARDLRERLASVLGDHLLQPPAEREHLTRLDLDVARLALETAGDLVEQDLGVRKRDSLPLVPPRTINAAIPIAMPTHIVCTSGRTNCIVS